MLYNTCNTLKIDKVQVVTEKLPAHLDHEVILFLHFTDTPHYLLIVGVHCARVHAQGWCCDIKIHPVVIVAPPTAVSGPITDAILIYKEQEQTRAFNKDLVFPLDSFYDLNVTVAQIVMYKSEECFALSEF